MWTIIKNKIRAFLLELLRDNLCQPEAVSRAAVPEQPKEDSDSRPVRTFWRVTGTAEVTYEITGLPHEGGVGRTFLDIDRVILLDQTVAISEREGWLIDQAYRIEQKKLGNAGMIFGRWWNEPFVKFEKKDYAGQ